MNDEMRVKCAEAMGWVVPTMRDKYPTHGQLKTGDDSYQELPRFTTSVDAALTLCDNLREEGWNIQIYRYPKQKWRVDLRRYGHDKWPFTEDTSLARAICLAFLRVKGLDSVAHPL